MNTDEMQAGDEINKLVAEKVMDGVFGLYSTEIADAWAVVNKKRFMGSVKIEWREGDLWHCVFASRGGGYFEAWAKTAPLAICRAALKAVGE